MRSPKTTEAAKARFLMQYEARVRACETWKEYIDLVIQISDLIRREGELYYDSTGLVDIRMNVSKRFKELGWVEVQSTGVRDVHSARLLRAS